MDGLYFSETEATAEAEYERAWRGLPSAHQPKLTYKAQVHLARVIDMRDPGTMRVLGLSAADWDATWRLAKVPTRLQEIGRAISRQHTITALRFPSAAARKRGVAGWNVAIYPGALVAPSRVEILGESSTPLEVIP